MSIQSILANATAYVVIDDGMFKYPVETARVGKTTANDLRAMSGDEYSAWCQDVPMVREVVLGSRECIDLCERLVELGADSWHIGGPE